MILIAILSGCSSSTKHDDGAAVAPQSPEANTASPTAQTEPRTEILREVGTPSLFVLEVNGGFCAAHKIAAGAKSSSRACPTDTIRGGGDRRSQVRLADTSPEAAET